MPKISAEIFGDGSGIDRLSPDFVSLHIIFKREQIKNTYIDTHIRMLQTSSYIKN
jgi:hypothetical protein